MGTDPQTGCGRIRKGWENSSRSDEEVATQLASSSRKGEEASRSAGKSNQETERNDMGREIRVGGGLSGVNGEI